MAPDERNLRERQDFRRRSLAALALSLAIHSAFFALLFCAPTGPFRAPPYVALGIEVMLPAVPGAGPEGGNRIDAGPTKRAQNEVAKNGKAPDNGSIHDASGEFGEKGFSSAEGAVTADAAGEMKAGFTTSDTIPEGSSDGGSGTDAALATSNAFYGAALPGDGGVSAFAAQLRSAVESRKTYPEAARRRGAEGSVRLKLAVAPDGHLLAAKIARSSGSAILDRAAVTLVSSVFPMENSMRRNLDLELSVDYSLSP
jgi:TonB family protein